MQLCTSLGRRTENFGTGVVKRVQIVCRYFGKPQLHAALGIKFCISMMSEKRKLLNTHEGLRRSIKSGDDNLGVGDVFKCSFLSVYLLRIVHSCTRTN